MQKKGAAFPIKVIVVIILILIILAILILFMTGTFKEVFTVIARYLGYANESLPQIPS